jgi:hypothetical protein
VGAVMLSESAPARHAAAAIAPAAERSSGEGREGREAAGGTRTWRVGAALLSA